MTAIFPIISWLQEHGALRPGLNSGEDNGKHRDWRRICPAQFRARAWKSCWNRRISPKATTGYFPTFFGYRTITGQISDCRDERQTTQVGGLESVRQARLIKSGHVPWVASSPERPISITRRLIEQQSWRRNTSHRASKPILGNDGTTSDRPDGRRKPRFLAGPPLV